MAKLFTQHPETVGETYLQHMHTASYFGVKMLGASFCCFVHAIFPFLFEKTGSTVVSHLHDRMIANRHRSRRLKTQGSGEPVTEGKT